MLLGWYTHARAHSQAQLAFLFLFLKGFFPMLRFALTRIVLPAMALAMVSLVAPSAQAQTFTLTFDAGDPIGGLAAGATLSNQYAAQGVTFSPNAFSGPGGPTGNWATNTNMSIVSSTGSDVGGLGTPSLVSGNLLRSFSGWLGENGDPSFRAIFSTPILSLSADFAGVATPASTGLRAYNGTTLLTSVFATTTTGQQRLTVSSATPITSVVFTSGDFFDWVGVDNITFTQVRTSSAVPEPGTVALVTAGMLPLSGMVIRRGRRRK